MIFAGVVVVVVVVFIVTDFYHDLFCCSACTPAVYLARCQGCVSSRWGCNWCIHQHVCTHENTCNQGVTIYNQNVSPH